MSSELNPVSQRYIILDVLRGFALLGICLANFSEFSLYTFQEKEIVEAMPTADIDHAIKFFQYLVIDGKFYSIFSLLFGIGFSIIISHSAEKSKIFYRRMGVLIVIGLLHLMFLWSGDILVLYALIGLLLPLFKNVPDKKLLWTSAVLIFFPMVLDTFRVVTNNNPDFNAPFNKAIQYFDNLGGITDDNFGVWLLEGKSYSDVLKFTLSGAFRRCIEFVEGNRVFKVLGLFLIGLYIGRNKIYAHLEENRNNLKKLRNWSFVIGLPLSCVYALDAVNQYQLGLIGHSAAYALSVIPLSFAYISSICIWYINNKERVIFKILAAPGKMALTNYIAQSIAGMIIFYGIGFALGATMGLVYVEIIAAGVYILLVLLSLIWLRYFQYGPLEWIWRIFTYGKYLNIIKTK